MIGVVRVHALYLELTHDRLVEVAQRFQAFLSALHPVALFGPSFGPGFGNTRLHVNLTEGESLVNVHSFGFLTNLPTNTPGFPWFHPSGSDVMFEVDEVRPGDAHR